MMSSLLNNLKGIMEGYSTFVTEYKYLALVICILVYAGFKWNQEKKREVRWFLIYAGILIFLLMVPLTAFVFAKYQTGFYGYGHVWSYVPLTALLAWGSIEIVFGELPPKEEKNDKKYISIKKWRWIGILAAVAVLFVAGNQGKLLRATDHENNMQQNGEEILHYMEDNDLLDDRMVWGAKDLLQYLRSHSGDVVLYYGRDMWDGAAGAYDYEGYDTVQIGCYEWMELISLPHTLYLLEIEQATDEIHEALATENYIRDAVQGGVNIIILPSDIDTWMERKIQLVAQEAGSSVATATAGDYTIWILNK